MSDKELMNAAEALKKHCSETSCDQCSFWKETEVNPYGDRTHVCILRDDAPNDWRLNSEEINAN